MRLAMSNLTADYEQLFHQVEDDQTLSRPCFHAAVLWAASSVDGPTVPIDSSQYRLE